MKKNMGPTKQTIRVVLAIIVALLYYSNVLSGSLALLLILVIGLLTIISLFSFCPLYIPFGINTKKKQALEPTTKWLNWKIGNTIYNSYLDKSMELYCYNIGINQETAIKEAYALLRWTWIRACVSRWLLLRDFPKGLLGFGFLSMRLWLVSAAACPLILLSHPPSRIHGFQRYGKRKVWKDRRQTVHEWSSV